MTGGREVTAGQLPIAGDLNEQLIMIKVAKVKYL